MVEHIYANAVLIRTFARDNCNAVVEYDDAGVRWLDAYIAGPAQQLDADVKRKMLSMFGSYLGECIRQTYGGRWVPDEEQGWGLELAKEFTVYPFNKVDKQMDQIEGDSVHGLFTAIGPMLARHRSKPAAEPVRQRRPASAPARRPWWKFW